MQAHSAPLLAVLILLTATLLVSELIRSALLRRLLHPLAVIWQRLQHLSGHQSHRPSMHPCICSPHLQCSATCMASRSCALEALNSLGCCRGSAS